MYLLILHFELFSDFLKTNVDFILKKKRLKLIKLKQEMIKPGFKPKSRSPKLLNSTWDSKECS